MRIAIDAMGGDHAPAEIVAGAVRAARDLAVEVVLVGPDERIRAELAYHRFPDPRVRVVHAAQVIEMHESPTTALRRKPDNSITRALELVRSGQADAFFSAGNTGAAMAAALFTLGRIEGVDRPAIAAVLPNLTGRMVLIDVGANVDCKPRHLLQFALMASVYAERVLGIPSPRLGLLSNGEEATKGNDLVLRAGELLRATDLNYIGHVEGRDVFFGKADVLVCDGFVGNVLLKLGEGMALALFRIIREEVRRSTRAKLAAWLLRPRLRAFQRRVDYIEYGGAPLLGVRGVCVIGHGSSDARAVYNAVCVAQDSVRQRIVDTIHEEMRRLSAAASSADALTST
ncbi:MAG: phosphate acyltransferase PlsX [Armatimonadota bacterium]|nr:phosphate acyltransferase PlsX [Armatimonadota bacterium]MDR5697464.1 phosphate acyltransferase PlsX [Armatimonadota bacterium]